MHREIAERETAEELRIAAEKRKQLMKKFFAN